MATFVLVHGGCHGGWCYSKVEAILLAEHHDVYAPTLSGLAERAALVTNPINLSTHVQDIVNLIEQRDLTDIVLCGHSYGGMVTTGVAGRIGDRIRTLFYLDGCLPEDGQSLFDLVGPERALRMIDASGETGTLMAAPAASFFKVRPENVEMVDRLCTPHPVACFIERLRHTGKELLVPHRTFVLCERYQSIHHATYAKVKNLLGWKSALLDCGHDAMIDEPDLVAALMLEELQR